MNKYNTLREREILKLRYGWDNCKCMTCQQLGEMHNVTKVTINNIECTALEKMRKSPWGARKAEELYIQKREESSHSIHWAIETMNFADKY
ncbi:sigma factor-like helix-turn-helix DNA-binding protein, partial [Clostridium sp. WILCCON 0269]